MVNIVFIIDLVRMVNINESEKVAESKVEEELTVSLHRHYYVNKSSDDFKKIISFVTGKNRLLLHKLLVFLSGSTLKEETRCSTFLKFIL